MTPHATARNAREAATARSRYVRGVRRIVFCTVLLLIAACVVSLRACDDEASRVADPRPVPDAADVDSDDPEPATRRRLRVDTAPEPSPSSAVAGESTASGEPDQPDEPDEEDALPDLGAQLRVRVLDASDQPVVGAWVRLHAPEAEDLDSAGAAADGWATLPFPPPMRARLVIYKPGYVQWIGEVETFTEGMDERSVRLDSGVTLGGVVMQFDGRTPAGGVQVVYSAARLRDDLDVWLPTQVAQTDVDGRFLFSGCEAGVRATVKAQPPDPWVTGSGASVHPLTGHDTARIVLRRIVSVQVLIVDASTGRAVAADEIQVFEVRDDKEQLRFTSGSRIDRSKEQPEAKPFGDIRLYHPGVSRLLVRARGYADSAVVSTDADEGPLRRTLRFELEPDPDDVATIVLFIRGDDGSVPTRMAVTRHRDGSWSSTTEGLVDGRTELEVSSGRTVLSVGSNPMGGDVDVPWLPQRLEIDVERGATVERIVTLRRGGFIRVRSEERPERLVHGDAITEPHFAHGFDDAGNFWTVGPLEAGRYVVELDDGDDVARATAEVQSGQTVELAFSDQ